jgi:aspartate aminotransferase-like enzyme
VAVRREVRRAFEQAPESHRSEAFTRDFVGVKESLRALTGATQVEICAGSGTLANDLVGAQLSLEQGPGIVLSNGEFGERLVDHAQRFGLKFQSFAADWGAAFDYAALETVLAQSPGTAWLWAVHCETSTGVLNDLPKLKDLCTRFGVKLCLDCISSIGTVPLDLAGVHLASCSSGKGLRSYAGLSMVFYHHQVLPSRCLPRYLDLGYYAAQGGVPFTISSNLIHALQAALKGVFWEQRFQDIAETSLWLRARLRELGFEILCPERTGSPAVCTLGLPREVSSIAVGNSLRESGYLLSFESQYLRQRNWLQVCLMGECSRGKVAALTNAMSRLCRGRVAVG